jgi:AraC-like DNA-binding protein/mannose-6-phosphate isomerase-like protein (cupin superfamily)
MKENLHKIHRMKKDMSQKLVMMRLLQDDFKEHDHHFFELAYVASGTAEHVLNGNRSILKPNDFFFIDFGSYHSFENAKNLELINCLFVPEFIDETLQGCESLDKLLHSSMIRYSRLTVGQSWADRILHDENGKIGALLSEMVEEYQHQQLGSQEIFRCHLKEILILTLRMLVQPQKTYSDSIVNDVILFVNKHYQSPLTLQTFCNDKHYNLSYISRRFKQETGMTFREYVQKIRIEKCCELLAGSDMTVSEIARAVGYDDIQFFHTVFKRMLHMTPKEYRKLRGA